MKNSYLYTCLLCLAACTVVSVQAQNATLPTTEAQTKAIIANRGQITDVPTVYIWMLDAELNKKQTKPNEYTDDYLETLDKNDYYYMVKTQGSSTYDLKVSNNIIKNNPSVTDNAVILPNYGENEPKSDQYRLARIKVVDGAGNMKVRDELTTIRGRGNSTWGSAKKPYRLKFPSKTKLLAKGDGSNEYADAKNWTLLANATDKSMLLNALTAEMSKKVGGMPFYPAYRFIDLVVNDAYIGTYQVSDHVQINPGRIDIDEDNGWFLEFYQDAAFAEDPHVTFTYGNNSQAFCNVKNPEDNFYTSEVETNIINYLSNAFASINPYYMYGADLSETTGVFKYVDINSLVCYMVANEVTGNHDGLISNYTYRDINEDDKLMFGPLWDFDLAYDNYEWSATNTDFIVDKGKDSWLKGILGAIMKNSPEFIRLMNKKWSEFYDNGNIITYLQGKINEIANTMKNSRILNYTPIADGGAGWGIDKQLVNGIYSRTYTTYEEAINHTNSFLNTHISFLSTAIPALKTSFAADAYTLNATATTSTVADRKDKICDVQLANRTFKAGEWNTICLPFSLTKDELQAKFGNSVKLLEYSSITGTTMNFTDARDTRLVAGVPYLLKFSGNDVTDPMFSQVAVCAVSPIDILYEANPNYIFKGVYTQTTLSADGTTLMLGAGEEAFKPITTSSSLVGVSAFITAPAGTTEVSIALPSDLPAIDYDVTDENVMAAHAADCGKEANVALTGRGTIWGNEWNAICLPFDATEETMTEVFGTGYELKTFGGAATSADGKKITFSFNSTDGAVTAGVPYLIRPTANVTDLTFNNVTFMLPEAAQSATADGFSYIGTLQPTLLTGGYSTLVLGRNNKLLRLSSDGTLHGCRAYFSVPENALHATTYTFDFGEGTDAITQVFVGDRQMSQEAVYNLSGQLIGTSLERLPKGIYVIGGKKIIK